MLGGLGVRLELTFDRLEDLQIALGALLECCSEDDEVTLRVGLEGTTLRLAVGPFDPQKVDDELVREPADTPSIQRVLETVADTVERADREDGAWVELTKQLEPTHG